MLDDVQRRQSWREAQLKLREVGSGADQHEPPAERRGIGRGLREVLGRLRRGVRPQQR